MCRPRGGRKFDRFLTIGRAAPKWVRSVSAGDAGDSCRAGWSGRKSGRGFMRRVRRSGRPRWSVVAH